MPHRPVPHHYPELDRATQQMKGEGLSPNQAADLYRLKSKDQMTLHHQYVNSIHRVYGVRPGMEREKPLRKGPAFFHVEAEAKQHRSRFYYPVDKLGRVHKVEVKTGRYAHFTKHDRQVKKRSPSQVKTPGSV